MVEESNTLGGTSLIFVYIYQCPATDCVCMQVCIFMCMCAYVCIHTHTHIYHDFTICLFIYFNNVFKIFLINGVSNVSRIKIYQFVEENIHIVDEVLLGPDDQTEVKEQCSPCRLGRMFHFQPLLSDQIYLQGPERKQQRHQQRRKCFI